MEHTRASRRLISRLLTLLLGILLIEAAIAGDPDLERQRLQSGVKGFPAQGNPVLLESAAGASKQQLAAQYQRLLEIEGVQIWYDGRGIPVSLTGKTRRFLPPHRQEAPDDAPLQELIVWLQPLLLAEGTEELRYETTRESKHGRTIVLSEFINGVPVYDGQVALSTFQSTGEITSIDATFLPDRELPREPRISSADALRITKEWLTEKARTASVPIRQRDPKGKDVQMPPREGPPPELAPTAAPTLAYYIGRTTSNTPPPRLVWRVELVQRDGIPYKTVLIDSQDGTFVGAADRSWSIGFNRRVFNSNNTANQGSLVFQEGGSSSDAVATAAYNNTTLSFDALGDITTPTMQTGQKDLWVRWLAFPSALVNANSSYSGGTQILRFGPGDPNSARPSMNLANALDVSAHEYGHLATWLNNVFFQSCQGIDCGQAAKALDEGFADVSAIAADLHWQRAVPWNVGDIYLTDALGIRSASFPKQTNLWSSDWWPQRDDASAARYLLQNLGSVLA